MQPKMNKGRLMGKGKMAWPWLKVHSQAHGWREREGVSVFSKVFRKSKSRNWIQIHHQALI